MSRSSLSSLSAKVGRNVAGRSPVTTMNVTPRGKVSASSRSPNSAGAEAVPSALDATTISEMFDALMEDERPE